MGKIGVVNLDIFYFLDESSSLKKDLLLFDELQICKINPEVEAFLNKFPADFLLKKRREIDTLLEMGLLAEHDEGTFHTEIDKIRGLNAWHPIADEIVSTNQKVQQLWMECHLAFDENKLSEDELMEMWINTQSYDLQVMARLISSIKTLIFSNNEYIPLLNSTICSVMTSQLMSKTRILNSVISHLPTLDESVSLSQLKEIKADDRYKLKYYAFRDFVNTLASSTLSINEINEKIEFLYSEYKTQFEIHKVKYRLSTLETVLVTSAEMIENLARLQFGKFAKNIISLKNREIELLEAESKIPGKEIALLYDIKASFQG